MTKKYTKIIAMTIVTLFGAYNAPKVFSASFPNNTKYDVCFTPDSNCTELIVEEINNTKKSIRLQAYSFTSAPIAHAITNAKSRGVDVKVILDKSQIRSKSYSSANYLYNQNIPLWIDYKPAIAHNKIIIIDENTIITGSFNFTKAAQERNAENVLIIHDAGLAKSYLKNWDKRSSVSEKMKIIGV